MKPVRTSGKNKIRQHSKWCRGGFTLVELMIAMGLFGLVSAGAISVYIMCQRMWMATTLNMQTAREANLVLSRIVYGTRGHPGLRSAAVRHRALFTNRYGYVAPGVTNYPLAANSTSHAVKVSSGANAPDGSWSLMVSNPVVGVQWLDYNRNASNIVLWGANNTDRVAIGEYIMPGTSPVTNVSSIVFTVIAGRRHGDIFVSSTGQTLIHMRN